MMGSVFAWCEQHSILLKSVLDDTGEGHANVKVTGVSHANGHDNLGSSVDDIPLIDLSTSSKESLSMEGQLATDKQGQKISDTVASQKITDHVSDSDNEVSDESDLVSMGIDSVKDDDCSEGTEPQKEEKVDRLTKLAQQIDDFDPSPIFEKKDVSEATSEDSKFPSDIDDEKLVDKWINDSGNEVGTNKDKSDEVGKGEITPSATEKDDVENKENLLSDNTDDETDETSVPALSNIETEENVQESEQNGDMSASTESEGFQEEKANVDNNNSEKEAGKIEESKASQSKQGSQKTETVSPTKNTKSKKKEDKSIGKQMLYISMLVT